VKLVLQGEHPNACQQACIAMLAGVELADVIAVIGSEALGGQGREQALAHFGLKLSRVGFTVEGWGENCLGALRKKYPTLWLRMSDCLDPGYGHAALLHENQVYDPFWGLNPRWPWHRYVSHATPVGVEVTWDEAPGAEPATI